MSAFVDGFTERDLATLAGVSGRDPAELVERLRARPWAIHDLLSDPALYDAVLDRHAHPADVVSPFLLFAVLVHRAADELREATYVNDWAGPKARLPVFDVAPLREFLGATERMAFLTALLASFAVVEPPPVPADPFDLADLALWVDQVTPDDRPVLLRRLGDVSLFLAGVFPDRVGSKPLLPVDAERLGRTVGMTAAEILSLTDPAFVAPGLEALESLGARWYGEVGRGSAASPPVLGDVAARFRQARRVLNHLSDRHLHSLEPSWSLAA